MLHGRSPRLVLHVMLQLVHMMKDKMLGSLSSSMREKKEQTQSGLPTSIYLLFVSQAHGKGITGSFLAEYRD